MKIAYILSNECAISGDSNGIKKQALTWANGIKSTGNEVVLIDPWTHNDWSQYDLIHIFGNGLWLHTFVERLYRRNPNIVFSPIIDSEKSKTIYKLASYMAIPQLRMYSTNYIIREINPFIKGYFVRSEYEREFITNSYNISFTKTFLVPLSGRFSNDNVKFQSVERDKFCLHISSIYQPRKNVIRLIEASKKYNFNLVLAGSKGNSEEFKPLQDAIGNSSNVKILGFISDSEMIDLYKTAKVFALPSISEGVGLVALDAAALGCDIVLTDIGAPKEYYNGMAYLVNPFSVDSIGQEIINAMGSTRQPDLSNHIIKNYSIEATIEKLIDAYQRIIQI